MATDFTPPTSRSAGKGGKLTAINVDVGDDYGKAITTEVDQAIRHMPFVVKYIEKKAQELQRNCGGNFEVIVSTSGEERPRAYVCPANNEGIHEELSESILLKMAASMSGQ